MRSDRAVTILRSPALLTPAVPASAVLTPALPPSSRVTVPPGPLPPSRRSWVRTSLLLAAVLAALLSLPLAGCPSASAAPPVDHRALSPNHRSELPGAGYLLTDPFQGRSGAYWAGAYRTIAGQRSYCVDDFYDYPDPGYGYRTTEVSGWLGRPGSSAGATGHTARRISWIVNSYGTSASPKVDAEVSMAINLLTGSQPFNRSYYGYFRAQLTAIDPGIVPAIEAMIRDSDRYAGPYRTEVRFAPAPPLGGSGTFTVLVRTASGFALPWTPVTVTSVAGLKLLGSRTGTTGHQAVATYRFTATAAGVMRVAATATAVPNTTIRLGYSPTHNGATFSTGSQRVALVSGHRTTGLPPGAASLTIAPPALHTVVSGGSVPHRVGDLVSDQLSATGLIPLQNYQLEVSLQDVTGANCGSVSRAVAADRHGRLTVQTPPLKVCGAGTDTFAERLLLGGRPVAVSPPGQPAETFPISPTISTAVAGGTGPRLPGSAVTDRVEIVGLAPGAAYRLAAKLSDAKGAVCGSEVRAVRSDQRGRLTLETAAMRACGFGRNTFTEVLSDSAGQLAASSPAWSANESFLLRPPPARSTPPPSAPPAHRVVQPVSRPVPQLANTGALPRLPLVAGLLGVGVGGLLLLGMRRGS
jgi:hypothetical protein